MHLAHNQFEVTNSNTSFVGVLTSREFFATQGIPTAFALGSGGVVVVPETHGRLDARSAGNTGGSYARPAQGSGAARPTQTTSARPRQK